MTSSRLNRGMVQVATLDDIRRVAPSVFAEQPSTVTSNRYAFVPTNKIVEEMMQNGWMPKAAAEQRVNTTTERGVARLGYQKHMLRFTLAGAAGMHTAVVGEVRPDILVINSHDASSGIRLMAGLFRYVCSNGMVVSDGTFQSINLRHTGRAFDIVEASYEMFNEVPKLYEEIELWKNRVMTPEEIKRFAWEAYAARFGEEKSQLQMSSTLPAPDMEDKILRVRRKEDIGSSLWSVFNRAQENLTNGGFRHYVGSETTGLKYRRSTGIHSPVSDIKFQRALWELARGYSYFHN